MGRERILLLDLAPDLAEVIGRHARTLGAETVSRGSDGAAETNATLVLVGGGEAAVRKAAGGAGGVVAVGRGLDGAAQAGLLAVGADDVIDLDWAAALVERRLSQLLEHARLRLRLGAELAAKRRELADARTLQLALVPPGSATDALTVEVVLEPAMELGGDLVDYVALPDGRYLLALGDVSGKGAAAALTMARTHTLLRSLALRSYASDLLSPPDTAAHRLNGMLAIENEGCMFVTMFLGLLDPASGEIAYVRCGHIPPFLRRRDGSVARLDAVGGPPLGVMEGVRYEVGHAVVGPGERLLIISDGVSEAEDRAGALLGEAPVCDWLSAEGRDLSRLVALARRHEAGAPPSDDLAALLVRRAEA